MHNNGIIITKKFISHWNSKRLRGSVGRAKIHTGYIFLKSNADIVVRNPNSKIFFSIIIYSLLSCLCEIFTIYTSFTLVKVATLGFISPLRGFQGARTAFSDSALMRDNGLFDMPVSLLAPSLEFDNGANSASFMASSLRTFKITFAATRILNRDRDSNLSGLRLNCILMRHFLLPREVCAVKKCEWKHI